MKPDVMEVDTPWEVRRPLLGQGKGEDLDKN